MTDSFAALGLDASLSRAAADAGFDAPSALQRAAIPVLRRGGNAVLVAAPGSGVTATIVLGLLDRLLTGTVHAGTDAAVDRPRALILTATEERATAIAGTAARLARGNGIPIRAWTAAWNRLPSPTLLVAPAGTAAQAIRESALKLDDLETLIIDGLDVVFALEDPAAFDTIVAAIPASAQRVVTLIERTPATDSFIAAQVRRAMVIPAQPAEAGQAEVTGAMSYIVVPPGQKITALARLLRRPRDVVPRIVTRSMAGAAAVREALQLRGWRVEPPAEQVSVVAATEAAQALIAYDVPFDAEALARLDRADGIIMVEARELPHLRAIAAQAGIQLTAVGGSRSTRGGIAAFRASVRAAIEEQDLGAQLALLGPLLEEHAPEEVAAALSALLRQRSSAPATATTASAEAGASDAGRGAAFVRLYISLGSRDGIRPGDLVGAITGEAAIAGDRVGKIDIRDNFSVVEVGAAEADRVIRALNGTTVKGRSLRVDYDRPQSGPARSGPARSGPTRSGPGPRRPRPDGGRRGR